MGWILHQNSDRVVIVTGNSANTKTGDMLQVWILAVAESPLGAIASGLDQLVCGDCKHRAGSCYVNVAQAPQSVYRAWQRGAYAYLPQSRYAEVFSGRMVRWGAYGDPAFIPASVLRWVSFFAAGWTGYTHQWRKHPELRPYLMASVDTPAEYQQATTTGWRTFRVRNASEPLTADEISCPASNEAGNRTTCADCGLCNGVRYTTDPRKSIAIVAHGIAPKVAKFQLIQLGA